MNGVLVIDKPKGPTSHDVVSAVKRKLRAKKVGHLGTLDPLATGVLPLVIDGATKFASRLCGNEKEYLAVMKLGETTDTYDSEGKVLKSSDSSSVTEDDVIRALKGLCGKIKQMPPMFSAMKKNGVPLYKLARKGITIEREPKQIEIFSIAEISVDFPFVTFTVACSAGTYVRTICFDAGVVLGCGGHLTELRRTRSGMFTLSDSIKLDETPENLFKAIMPLPRFTAALGGRDRFAEPVPDLIQGL
ncbi:MAG: tRNA pseudouridine(55) synthase TruB [Thermodesulfobacteriota bacterium]